MLSISFSFVIFSNKNYWWSEGEGPGHLLSWSHGDDDRTPHGLR